MPATKVTKAILSDIEQAKHFNFTSVPDLRAKGGEKAVGPFRALLRRYYIETALYAVERWEMHVTNIVSIAVFFFLAKSLYTLVTMFY